MITRSLRSNQKPNQGGIGMADVNSTVQNAASGVVGVIKALIVCSFS